MAGFKLLGQDACLFTGFVEKLLSRSTCSTGPCVPKKRMLAQQRQSQNPSKSRRPRQKPWKRSPESVNFWGCFLPKGAHCHWCAWGHCSLPVASTLGSPLPPRKAFLQRVLEAHLLLGAALNNRPRMTESLCSRACWEGDSVTKKSSHERPLLSLVHSYQRVSLPLEFLDIEIKA